jgi:DNA repair exonuclease SbcCD nuclease subunit
LNRELTIAVTADSHLGRKYPTMEFREDDINRGFDLFLDSIISDRPDILIHGGDLFDTVFPPGWIFERGLSGMQSLPEPETDLTVTEEARGEEVAPNIFIVHGNHDGTADARCESGCFSVLKYFDSMSLANYLDVRRADEDIYFPRFVCRSPGVTVAIQGLGHRSTSQFQNLLGDMEPVDGVDHNILVVHQAISDLTTPYTRGDVLPMDLFLDRGLDLVIAGHTHRPVDDRAQGTRFIIPGSSERMDSGEFGERRGYYLVRMTPDEIECAFRMVDLDVVRKIRKYEVDVDALSGTEITRRCMESVTDPDLSDALVYFLLRGQTPHGHRDVDREGIEERLVGMGARSVKINTQKIIMKEIGELVTDAEWRNVRITAETFNRLFSERNIRDLSGNPIRDQSLISRLSDAAYGMFSAYERDRKEEIPEILDRKLMGIAEELHREREEETVEDR